MAVVLPTPVEVPTRVLVFGMARQDGSIDASELYPVAEACGQSAEQLRSCLRRLVSEKLLTRSGTGRTAIFRTTPAGERLVGTTMERHQLAYLQDSQGRGWDRRWHLVAFAIPEARRGARDQLRDRLLAFGGAAVGNGLYVSAHPWEKDVRGEAERLDVLESLTLASTDDLDVAGVHDPRSVALRLWPVDELSARYKAFVEQFRGVVPLLQNLRSRHERIADADFLPGALQMVTAFNECFGADPLLPPELLPRPWPGRAARELLVTSRRLALRIREVHERPALFRAFDDLIEQIP